MWVEGVLKKSGLALRYKANRKSEIIRTKIKIMLALPRCCDDETIGDSGGNHTISLKKFKLVRYTSAIA